MVKNVPDRMHGFGERPHYEQRELDAMFEQLAVAFLKKKHGTVSFPGPSSCSWTRHLQATR